MGWGCASAPSAARIAASEADPREVIHVKTQASASTPGKAERGIIRGKARASASTPGKAEREVIRGKARASTVVGQARWGCEPWVIVRGEGARASAAQRRCRGRGRERALDLGIVLLGTAKRTWDTMGEGPREAASGGLGRGRVSGLRRSRTATVRQALRALTRLTGLSWCPFLVWVSTYEVGALGRNIVRPFQGCQGGGGVWGEVVERLR